MIKIHKQIVLLIIYSLFGLMIQIIGWIAFQTFEIFSYKYCTFALSGEIQCLFNSIEELVQEGDIYQQYGCPGLSTCDCNLALQIRFIYVTGLIIPLVISLMFSLLSIFFTKIFDLQVMKSIMIKITPNTLLFCNFLCAILYLIESLLLNSNFSNQIHFSSQTMSVCIVFIIFYLFQAILVISFILIKQDKDISQNKIQDELNRYNDINQESQRLILKDQRERDEYKNRIAEQQSEISDLKSIIEQKVKQLEEQKLIIEQKKDLQIYPQIELNENDIKLSLIKQKGNFQNKQHSNEWTILQDEYQDQMIQNQKMKLLEQFNENQIHKQKISDQTTMIASLEQKLQEQILQNEKLSKQILSKDQLVKDQKDKILDLMNKKKYILTRIKNNNIISKKELNMITTAIFDLFRKFPDISQILINENAQTDEQQFTVQKIIGRKEILEEKIKKLSDLDFNDAYKQEPVGEITCIKSLQPNGTGSYSKVSVLQDVNSKQFYVIKELNTIQTNQSISSLQQFFLPTLIAEFILDKFVESLKKYDAERQPYKFRFQEQFIFQQNTKYNYAQKISQEDKFNLYNGKQNKQSDIKVCQYLNAYSIFSYKYSVHQLMIDNIQGSSDTLYDPIINTEEGVFNEEDLGQYRIDELMRNAKDDEKFYGKELLALLSIKI